MATDQEIEQARQRLEENRRRIEALQSSIFDDPESRSPGVIAGTIDSVAQGLTFGFGDEIESAIRSPFVDDPFEGATIGDRFRDLQFKQKQRREAFRETNPFLSLASEITGGIMQGQAIFNNPLFRTLPALPRLAATGGVEGGLFGLGTAGEGDRTEGAVRGALTGTVLSPLVGFGATITAGATRPIVQKLVGTLTSTPRERAVSLITKNLMNDNITPTEAAALIRRFGPEATLADVGENVADLTRTAASVPGPGKARATRFLNARQESARMRIQQDARRLGAADDLERTVADVINGAESAASDLYRRSYMQSIHVTPELAALLKRPAMASAMNKAKRKVLDAGHPAEIVDDITDMRFMDMTKRSLDDQIGVAQRQGRRDDVRILNDLKREFLDHIDEQVPLYAQAREIFSGEASVRDAVELGNRSLRGNQSLADIQADIGRLNEGELQAFRHGLINGIVDQLDSATNITTIANKFRRVPRFRDILTTAFPDQNELQRFLNRATGIAREAQTRNTVIGGSPTARIQASQRAAADEFGMLNTIADVSTGGQTAVVRNLRQMLADDIDEDVADQLVRILLDPGVIPARLGPSVSERVANTVVPRLGRGRFAGAVGGATGSQFVGPEAILRGNIIDTLTTDPRELLFPDQDVPLQ